MRRGQAPRAPAGFLCLRGTRVGSGSRGGVSSRALCPHRRAARGDWTRRPRGSRWKAALGRGKHRLLYLFSEDDDDLELYVLIGWEGAAGSDVNTRNLDPLLPLLMSSSKRFLILVQAHILCKGCSPGLDHP
ncbi:uncharacterized protein LOC128790815 [Vidua chalybeata]|uniref:uncharacterized protein LOC128790815 n=1 Tax=Vidua chalybeata TaxID=81927 RepID=UPI0023A87912|nr:uncharacterized protein LOC128790815 [Vidua chalybeata]